MHMIACCVLDVTKTGESAHHYWDKKRTVGTLNSTEDIVEIWKHICDYRSIYPQLAEFELERTIHVYQCVWRNKLFEERLTLL